MAILQDFMAFHISQYFPRCSPLCLERFLDFIFHFATFTITIFMSAEASAFSFPFDALKQQKRKRKDKSNSALELDFPHERLISAPRLHFSPSRRGACLSESFQHHDINIRILICVQITVVPGPLAFTVPFFGHRRLRGRRTGRGRRRRGRQCRLETRRGN